MNTKFKKAQIQSPLFGEYLYGDLDSNNLMKLLDQLDNAIK